MKLKIEIDLDNSAFEDKFEICRILKGYVNGIESESRYSTSLRDVNGNTVGFAKVVK